MHVLWTLNIFHNTYPPPPIRVFHKVFCRSEDAAEEQHSRRIMVLKYQKQQQQNGDFGRRSRTYKKTKNQSNKNLICLKCSVLFHVCFLRFTYVNLSIICSGDDPTHCYQRPCKYRIFGAVVFLLLPPPPPPPSPLPPPKADIATYQCCWPMQRFHTGCVSFFRILRVMCL